jgi:hypothetical protein
MSPVFRFSPVASSWIAIHPQPKGVIQFIGGAFFGTFPTIFYRYFLQTLFEAGYTIVALPFRFSFRHWEIAIELLREQQILRHELIEIANKLDYAHDLYQEDKNYYWLGHSLGCKYIALLEFLSGERWQQIASNCLGKDAVRQIESIVASASMESASILDQPSLLIAPNIGDTASAIPVPAIANLLDRVGWGVRPSRIQTQCSIENSRLFNLTASISFDRDTIAGSQDDEFQKIKARNNSDVGWLIGQLKNRKFPILHQELSGKHLEPLGIRIGNYVVDLNPFDKFIAPLKSRQLEHYVLKFIDALEHRSTK